jgi:Spy/CpxP family protein refolding chaperone
MKKLILVLLVGMVLGYGGSVFAQSTDSGHDHGAYSRGPSEAVRPGRQHDGMERAGRFSLTSEQREKFRDLRQRFIRENAQLIGTLVAKRLEFQSLWTDPKADPKAIVEKGKELGALQAQMHDKMLQGRVEARSFLTPDQISRRMPRWFFQEHMGMMGRYGRMMGERGMRHEGRMDRGRMMHHRGMMDRGGMMQGHGMGGMGMSGQGQMMQHGGKAGGGQGMMDMGGCCGGGPEK